MNVLPVLSWPPKKQTDSEKQQMGDLGTTRCVPLFSSTTFVLAHSVQCNNDNAFGSTSTLSDGNVVCCKRS